MNLWWKHQYKRFTNFAIEQSINNKTNLIKTINTSLEENKDIKKELSNNIVHLQKPTIIFYEPFEVMIKQTTKYIQETNMTESELLDKYNIDYDSFLTGNIRDEKGNPENLQSKQDIHIFLLNYINN